MALALGRSVEELRNTLTAAEFEGWKLFHSVEPWGEPTLDERTRILASVFVNSQGGDTTPRDFDFSWDQTEKPQRILLSLREGFEILAGSFRSK